MYGGNLVTRSLVGTRLVGGTWTASGTWTLPAVTLGGAVAGGGQFISNCGGISYGAAVQSYQTVDNSIVYFRAGTLAAAKGFVISLSGVDYASPSQLRLVNSDAAGTGEITRLIITGKLAVAVATWASITHSGLDITSGQVLKVAGTQVVGARVVDARADDVVDSTYGAEEAGVLDALRDAMITHGLISAS